MGRRSVEFEKTIYFLILVAACLYALQPPEMFDEQGTPKGFGTGPNETMTPAWMFLCVVSIMFYRNEVQNMVDNIAV